LPGAGSFGKEHGNTGGLRQCFMTGHFHSLVPD
jgi:hypothetical protein